MNDNPLLPDAKAACAAGLKAVRRYTGTGGSFFFFFGMLGKKGKGRKEKEERKRKKGKGRKEKRTRKRGPIRHNSSPPPK